MALNVIIVGPPGSGKGTQADWLAAARGIPKISTGDILREAIQAGTQPGLGAIMDRGELVGDDVMVGIVRRRLQEADARRGFILDGFPRTLAQAEALDKIVEGHSPLIVIELAVPDEELFRRMRIRRVCSRCGMNAEPGEAVASVCRRCGGPLMTRADDSDAAVRARRLQVYARESQPLLDYYRGRPTFRTVDGAERIDRVAAHLATAIDSAVLGDANPPARRHVEQQL